MPMAQGALSHQGPEGHRTLPPPHSTCHITRAQPRRTPQIHTFLPQMSPAGDRAWGGGSWRGSACIQGAEPCPRAGGEGCPRVPCRGQAPGPRVLPNGKPCQPPPARFLLPAVAFKAAAKYPACCQQPSGGNSTPKVFPSIQTGKPTFLLGFIALEVGLLKLSLAFQQPPLILNHDRHALRLKSEGKQHAEPKI